MQHNATSFVHLPSLTAKTGRELRQTRSILDAGSECQSTIYSLHLFAKTKFSTSCAAGDHCCGHSAVVLVQSIGKQVSTPGTERHHPGSV